MFLTDSSDNIGHEFADHEIILGELVPGNQPVTLAYCKERQRKSPYISNTVKAAIQRFKVEYIVFSHHAKEKENLKFSSFEFSTTYLMDWVYPKLVDFKTIQQKMILTALPAQTLKIIEENSEISISSWINTSLGPTYNLTQHSSIIVDVNERISLEEFKERFEMPLLHLIQFGSSLLNSVTFLNATPQGQKESLRVVYANDFNQITPSLEPAFHYFLFNQSDVEDAWDSFLLNWLRFHRKSQHIFRLYFDSMNIGFQFAVSRFLNLIQAVESYHSERMESPDTFKNKESFAHKKKLLLTYAEGDQELSEWIKKEITFFPTLRIRLDELINESKEIVEPIIGDTDLFISKVVDSRNYYTHYGPKKKTKAAFGIELEALIYTLRILLNYHILIECNLDRNKCIDLIKKSQQFMSVKQIVNENNFWKGR